MNRRKHTVHIWRLWSEGKVMCVVCGILRPVAWPYDPAEESNTAP